MNPKITKSVASFLIISGLLIFAFFQFKVATVEKQINNIGGIVDSTKNALEVDNLAKFAIQEHNKKKNSKLEFVRVIKAREQVVSGMTYYITLEATDADDESKVYETSIWVKPWMDFKEVQEFKVSGDP